MKALDFFERSADTIAKDLVGCYLVVGGSEFQITEVEAYLGEEDAASHARFGKTARGLPMYGPAGVVYVYLVYGMHNMLNIVTGPEGEPGAVLIRGIRGADGPGKLTKKLGITKESHNGKLLGDESGLWIEDRQAYFDPEVIQVTPRIGIQHAEPEWRDKKLRFVWDPLESKKKQPETKIEHTKCFLTG